MLALILVLEWTTRTTRFLFRFTGKLDKLTIKLEPTQQTDADRQKAAEMIARAHDNW